MSDVAAPLRLLIVDDHEVVRRGLVAYLDRRDQFQVVAEAGTCAEAVAQARRFVPDIVLLDIQLPDASGIEACRMLRDEFPEMVVVFLTSSPDELDVFGAIISGARGYVLKQTRSAVLVATLEAVGRGESLFDPGVTGMVLDRVRRIASGAYPDETAGLTAREREILPLLAAGRTNREIAADGLPLRQDREELRQLDPGEAGPEPPRPGADVRGHARPGPHRASAHAERRLRGRRPGSPRRVPRVPIAVGRGTRRGTRAARPARRP